MPNIGIVTINYNRPRILDLWLASIDRLRKAVGWFPAVVVSERADADACGDHGVHHIYQENEPVSFKWNTGVQWLM
jgi:glycosyltransferase involved in cell wall biosynthesis